MLVNKDVSQNFLRLYLQIKICNQFRIKIKENFEVPQGPVLSLNLFLK